MFVLIVEDEPVARMAHLALMSQHRGLTAVGASTVAEARAIIAEATPALVILDLQLPDGTGIDVLGALTDRRAGFVVAVVSAHLDKSSAPPRESERLYFLEKPTPLRELRRIIDRVQAAPEPPAPLTVLDHVQLACMSRWSGAIECELGGGRKRGRIVVKSGQPWSAEDDRGTGTAALYRILRAAEPFPRLLPLAEIRDARNIAERWDHLLGQLPAATRPTPVPSHTPVPAPTPAPADAPPLLAPGAAATREAEFDACVDRALRAVVARDFERALTELEKARVIHPNDELVRHRIARLRAMRGE